MFDYYNPYQARSEVVKVNGENGARAFQMAPNSSALLLDTNDPIVYLAVTDGAGYKTVTAYDIQLHVTEEQVSFKTLEDRISRIEARLNESHDETAK